MGTDGENAFFCQVVRQGDTFEFFCPDGYYVEGQSHTTTSVVKECLSDGSFTQALDTESCVLIPCDQDDIDALTPAEGDFETTSVGEISPPGAIRYTCVDTNKVSELRFSLVKSWIMVTEQELGLFLCLRK